MNINQRYVEEPVLRSRARIYWGEKYYSFKRYAYWWKHRKTFAKNEKMSRLPFEIFRHQTILRRQLLNVDMWYQENKIINLSIAVPKLNHIIVKPGERLSYWRIIGNPSRRKGYVDGMILGHGKFYPGVGGGLCQLSNLIFWLTIHTPLTIIERHRHGYDVFPDSARTQPFGSGATCFYPYMDLVIENQTNALYQLELKLTDEYLIGRWLSNQEASVRYEIIERNHEMKSQPWGGYTRHNELYQQIWDFDNQLIQEKKICENDAIMMYSPFIESSK